MRLWRADSVAGDEGVIGPETPLDPQARTFLHREDFTSGFIEHGASGGTPIAAIDWDAAITALHAGELPCSAGERRIQAAAASIAAGIRVDLRDIATGLDARNIRLLITAISPAAGQRPPVTAEIHDGLEPAGRYCLAWQRQRATRAPDCAAGSGCRAIPRMKPSPGGSS